MPAVFDDDAGHAHLHPRQPTRTGVPRCRTTPPPWSSSRAGGLGTRVHGWARFIPKEFYPVGGRPGIAHLLEEIAALGPAAVAIVYHPYYEQFAAWGAPAAQPRRPRPLLPQAAPDSRRAARRA